MSNVSYVSLSITFAMFPVTERTCALFLSIMGTSTLSCAGRTISRFFSSIKPMATMRAFACPCFPLLPMSTETTLHADPSMTMYDPSLTDPAPTTLVDIRQAKGGTYL